MSFTGGHTVSVIEGGHDVTDADSEPGLPLLSPLPKSTGVNVQKKISRDPEKMKASSKRVHKGFLIQENGIQEDEIIRESPFKEIAPIKTSSPIALAIERDESVRPVADPLLFGVEDEEPIGGDLNKVACIQQSEPVKESLCGDSGSLTSPPERLEFRKNAKSNAGSFSSMKLPKNTKTSVQATQSLPPEIKEDLIVDKDPGQLSPVLVQKSEPKLREAEQCRNQVMEDPGKRSSFQQKLKKAMMPKSPCSRKRAAVPAPPPVDLEEDFMILDDEAPVLFIIPRKAETSRNKKPVPADTAKENVLTEPHSTEQLSLSEAEMTNQHGLDGKRSKAQIESGKQKPKGKHGKVSKKSGKDSVTHNGVVEDGADPVTEVLEDRVCDLTSSETVQARKEVQAEKKRSNSKAPEPVQLSEKDETDGVDPGGSQEIPVPVSKATKKPLKSSKQENPGSNAKKKSNKVTAAAALHSTKSVKSNKNRRNSKKEETVTKTKKQTSKQQIKLKQSNPSCDEQVHELPPALNEQEEEQRKAVSKQSSTIEDAVDPGEKQKRKEKQRREPKPKDPPTTVSDISSDSPLCTKRKRKPPGSWWLSSPNESTTELQPKQVFVTSQELKASKKTSKKQAAAVDSEETQSLRHAQGNQKKPKTHNVLDNVKKLITVGNQHDTGAEQKTAKKTGGRRKPKSAATLPQVASPAHRSGEEVGACPTENAVEISPEFCNPHRQHSVLPGEKRVFDLVYSRDVGSAQKPPSSSLRRPESSASDNFPQKRQRKAPSNWWEAPQSQEPEEELPPPRSPPQKSKLSNTPLRGGFNKEANIMKLQKTNNHTRNIKRNIINTPKSIKRSLASMNAIFASEKNENLVKSGQRSRKQGRRNLLHSLEDQSDHSSENVAQSDDQLQGDGRTSFGFTSGVTVEPPGTRKKMSVRVSSGPNTLSDVDVAFRSGPSSVLELQQHDEEDEDIVLPSSKLTAHVRQAPRVLAQCDLCGPPLEPVVLENEDWDNLHAWFSHLWPPASKNGRVISPDDFHWHSHGGRAMGHTVDLQSHSFSHGKILLGSFMKKPSQVDHDMVYVFSIISSCVRVDIDGVKSVYNSGEVFMIPSGQAYSIHNLCQEPAVLIYHRTQSNDTPS
ncbi:muscle M-line assembly protein unc-89 isoform X2 [Pseudorasbora parva]|uniref:muscle M-line assembly protein unc-89 isoform X2 n=1 Tax=Pseudorasbora parva TaxID=51549 RepID=UPI00351DC950